MESPLLEQFAKEECAPAVRDLLERALTKPTVLDERYEFNRFDITVRSEDGSILIEDVLDAGESGQQRVGISEFLAVIRRSSSRSLP